MMRANVVTKPTYIKLIQAAVAIVLFAAFFIQLTQLGAAQSSVACDGLNEAGNFCSTPATSPTINRILGAALNILSLVAGFAAVIMFIVGGTKYITSGGDPGSVSSAKNTLLFAAIGIVIVAVSQTVVFFFIGEASSAL